MTICQDVYSLFYEVRDSQYFSVIKGVMTLYTCSLALVSV